ncbi:MAG: radical SAM protein [Acidobacteria bacterium]|nr:radical SAM protein [Acidobacteriota bacterium]
MAMVSFLWLEITGKCQLECVHCYAESGPSGTHGTMARSDWERVLDQARDLGVKMVQFIGGEPTLHPDLAALINHALRQGLLVEVFSNLTHVSPSLWEVFSQPGVRLATSYYTDDPDQHEKITQRRGSYAHTKANIIEAVRRSISLRVGLINVDDDQRVEQARSELKALGVQEIGMDRLRQVGRGIRNQQPNISQLCGSCGGGSIAILPDGTVSPCPISRWITIGNVHEEQLFSILTSQKIARSRNEIRAGRDYDYFPNNDCQPREEKCFP